MDRQSLDRWIGSSRDKSAEGRRVKALNTSTFLTGVEKRGGEDRLPQYVIVLEVRSKFEPLNDLNTTLLAMYRCTYRLLLSLKSQRTMFLQIVMSSD